MKLWFPLAALSLALVPLSAPLLAGSHPLAALVIRSFFSRACAIRTRRAALQSRAPL